MFDVRHVDLLTFYYGHGMIKENACNWNSSTMEKDNSNLKRIAEFTAVHQIPIHDSAPLSRGTIHPGASLISDVVFFAPGLGQPTKRAPFSSCIREGCQKPIPDIKMLSCQENLLRIVKRYRNKESLFESQVFLITPAWWLSCAPIDTLLRCGGHLTPNLYLSLISSE